MIAMTFRSKEIGKEWDQTEPWPLPTDSLPDAEIAQNILAWGAILAGLHGGGITKHFYIPGDELSGNLVVMESDADGVSQRVEVAWPTRT